MSALELKIPPPLVLFVCGLLMWLPAYLLPGLNLELPGRLALAVLLVICGLGVAGAGVLAFRQASTTINPTRPSATSSIVSSGVYRFTRNPMYLGMLLCLGGWALFLGNPLSLLGLPLFVAYLNRMQIGPEERALGAKFGEPYAQYRSRVRRWI
ncbi:isoprenylcysteine carboxylmethyltransferase family protein [Pseudomonas sp. L-22-4S-12]|uniref:methyltransferase family protein n=1 Tax=Pseudomonas sp. L-22-4S-12 TaxID=2610893 RepID=UPI00132413BE|nr:isoprenylcysteine carboxylmethyltransferase family protein [Pseudomonas sp. L-22-4S-12]MWV16904.1 isoprenylcysteine carboxylmethyltransferase family protein [Pseudomonas sp. L-22-4S-12]